MALAFDIHGWLVLYVFHCPADYIMCFRGGGAIRWDAFVVTFFVGCTPHYIYNLMVGKVRGIRESDPNGCKFQLLKKKLRLLTEYKFARHNFTMMINPLSSIISSYQLSSFQYFGIVIFPV